MRWIWFFVAVLVVSALGALVGILSLKLTGRPKASTTAPKVPPYSATLDSGIEVEIVGLTYHPAPGQTWWKPDGSPLAEAPYKELDAKASGYKNEKMVEIAARLSNLPKEQVSVIWTFKPPIARSSGNPSDERNGDTMIRAYIVSVGAENRTVTVRMGVASKQWKTVTTTRGTSGMTGTSGSHGSVVFVEPVEMKGETRITSMYSQRREQKSWRVVAVDTSGTLHTSSRQSIMGTGGRTRLATTRFRKLPLARVREFQFQVRPYEWVEFEGIVLWPKENKAESE